ncbi:MAG: hypothetical protein IPJ32_14370 [Sphingobacteriaceae bacterium]|nr:hypothetical protein [Sphingobacteriaceae bacterium]
MKISMTIKRASAILILVFFYYGKAGAQAPTNSAAKIYYKGVLKHFETIKNLKSQSNPKNDGPQSTTKQYLSEVDKAEEKIKLIKKSQPDYDISALTAELNEYKSIGSETKKSEENASIDAAKLRHEMDVIFKAPSLNDFTGGQSSAESALKDYKTLCSNFLSNDGKLRVDNAKKIDRFSYSSSFSMEMNGFASTASILKTGYNKSDTENGAIGYYYLVSKYLVYWETAKSSVPDEKLFSDNYTLAANLLKEMGSVETAKNIAKNNAKARMAKVKIPVAARKDVATETLFKKAFEAEGWNETIMVVNLREHDWSIVKHENTGVILGRAQTAAIAAKNKNGDCLLYIFTIMQDYNGSGYQSNAYRRSHDVTFMLCENAK